jgi:predicted lipoprotein with Yx(FWY)xxD motif
MKARLFAACSLGLIAIVAVAGCGGSSNGSATAATKHSSSGASGGSGGSSGSGGTVAVANNSQLGRILVDSQGRTVYTFAKDMNGTSSCSGQCATFWPPVVAKGKPTAGTGVTASMVGSTTGSGGTMQVTYAGHPLYTYAGDTAPGQAKGNGLTDFGGLWSAVTTSGSATPSGGSSSGGGGGSSASGSSSGSSSSSSGGSSYGY